jgi:predicted ArsR family transcriptional regulator
LEADAAPRARTVGQRWGAALARKDAGRRTLSENTAKAELVRVLDDVGFAPEVDPDDGRRVLLRHCPFLEAAEAHAEVVCSVHRGLMDGALAEMGAPLVTERLIPFAEPRGCVAQLVRNG